MRTADIDANWLSLTRDAETLYAGTPEARQLDRAYEPIPTSMLPGDPKQWDSILKCSGRENTHLTGLRVAQGKENCFDANNRTIDCSFVGEWGVEGNEGEQVFTIKGGSRLLSFGGPVYSRGTDCDIELGSWSDQSIETTHDISLYGLYHASGRPLTVVLGRVNQPWRAWIGRMPDDIEPPENAKVLIWGSIVEQIGWWAKWIAVKIGLYR